MKKSAAANIDLGTPAPPARNVRRKGKKSVPYYDDPEILKRLATVAENMAKGKPAHEIASLLKCSLGTAKRDIARVRELWKADAREAIDYVKEESINVYRRIQIEAWGQISEKPDKADRYMMVVLAAQKEIDRLNGAGEPDSPQNANVVLGVTVDVNVDDVRQKRWEKVEDKLVKLAVQQEGANP